MTYNAFTMPLITRHVVKALIRAVDTGRFFIIRSTIPIMPGWSLVGGGMGVHENEIDALYREIKEELRVTKEAFSKIEKRNGIYTSHNHILGIPITMHNHLFEVTVPIEANFKPKPNWEVAESRWVTETEMNSLLGEHYRKLANHR